MPEFSSKNEGTWFYFDPDHEELGGVCLRELTTDEYERIEKLTVKHRKKFKRGIAFDDIETDEKLASKLRWDWCIVDWKEVSLDGIVLECTTDNKVNMMKVLDFIKHVANSIEELTETNKSLEEARLKNSGSSSSDKLKSRTAKPV